MSIAPAFLLVDEAPQLDKDRYGIASKRLLKLLILRRTILSVGLPHGGRFLACMFSIASGLVYEFSLPIQE